MIDDKEEEKPDTQDEKKGTDKDDDQSERFDRLERENQELKATTQRSLEEAAAARGQVSVILEQIQRAAAAGDQQAQAAQQQVKSLRDRFDDDPVAAMNELVTMRVGPIVQEYFGRSADNERDAARQKHGKTFEKYEAEIDEFMRDMPLDVKAKPGSYTAALKYVRSQHLDDEIEEAKKAERERASNPEGASPAESGEGRKKALSKDEREIMKAFEMDEDDWDRWATPGGVRPTPKKKTRAA
jgi:hypothetical protein